MSILTLEAMGNIFAPCTSASPEEPFVHTPFDPCYPASAGSPGPEELMGFGDLSALAGPPQLHRACSEEAMSMCGLTGLFSGKSFLNAEKKAEKKAAKKQAKLAAAAAAAAALSAPPAAVAKPPKSQQSAAERQAAEEAEHRASIHASMASQFIGMPLGGLLALLGSLSGVKSVRMAEVEHVAREAEARVREIERLEAAMKAPAAMPVVAVPIAVAPAVAAEVPSTIVVSASAPIAPPLDAPSLNLFFAKAGEASASSGYWAKGTGFGYHGAAGDWDIDVYMRTVRDTQHKLGFVCGKICERLEESNEDATLEVVAQSALVPFLESYLSNDSFNEILEQHAHLYASIFGLVAHMLAFGAPAVSPFAALLRPKCQAFLAKIAKGAAVIEKIDSKADAAAALSSSSALSSPAPSAACSSPSAPAAASRSASTISPAFVIELSRTLDAILALPQEAQPCATSSAPTLTAAAEPSTDRESSVSSSSASAAEAASDSDSESAPVAPSSPSAPTAAALAEYSATLSTQRFDEVERFAYHKYQTENKGSSTAPISRTFTRRLAVEYATLAECLPVHWGSSIWMRVHESTMQYAQVLVSGPDGTPYENGLFLFDVHFPPTYPADPPQVNLQTTGKGAVRFNPNLYNCGKVCLSILGTWGGGVGEGWSAKSSTFLQVAVSIQSLVFVPQPYFNEPSYESTMHTASGKAASAEYSRPLLHSTLKWAVLDQLQHPPAGFEEVVRMHFARKKQRILAQAMEWSAKNPEISALVPDLTAELEKLKL